MGCVASADQADRPTLINRTWIDVSRYRTEAARLGYDDAALDGMVERWKMLLERARRLPAATCPGEREAPVQGGAYVWASRLVTAATRGDRGQVS